MTDLTERLRKSARLSETFTHRMLEAADEIDRLRAALRVAEAGLYAAILRTAPKTDSAIAQAHEAVRAALQEADR